MRISKEKARVAAEKIVAPLTKKIKDYKEQVGLEVLAEYEKRIPAEVMKCFKKFPGFFKTDSQRYIGFIPSEDRSFYCKFGKALPEVQGFEIGKREAATYISNLETLIDERDNAALRIENTILALGTLKRVQAEFPEALPYIEVPQANTALMINVAPVRQLACNLIPGCGDKK